MATHTIRTEHGSYTYASEAAYLEAEDWYNATPKPELLAWADEHGVQVRDGDKLAADWADILMQAWARLA